MKGFYLWIDVDQNYKLDQGELHELKDYKIEGFSIPLEDHILQAEAYIKGGGIMLTEDLWFTRRRRY